jgi:threonine/homoserine/homoserine lactone efflux protein
MNTSNPKFWAIVGAVVGFIMAAGGELNTPADAIFGAIIQSAIWFGVSTLIINHKKKNKS